MIAVKELRNFHLETPNSERFAEEHDKDRSAVCGLTGACQVVRAEGRPEVGSGSERLENP